MSELETAPVDDMPEFRPSDDVMDQLDSLVLDEPEEPNSPEKEAAEPEAGREPEEPEEVQAEPEKAEVEIDYELVIPMPDGRDSMTLGQMKDRVNELERTDQQLIERENALMRQQAELTEAMEQMGGIPPALQQQAAQRNEQRLRQEHDLMLKAIPEWSEKETFDRDRALIFETAKQYGLDNEIGQISDHRIVKLLRDFSRLLGKSTEAETLKKEIHTASTVKGKKAAPRTKQSEIDKLADQAKAGNDDAGWDAIDKLLGVK